MNKIKKARIFFFSFLFIIIGSLVALGFTGEHVEIFLALIFGSICIFFSLAPHYYKDLYSAVSEEISLSFAEEKHWNQEGLYSQGRKFDTSLLNKVFRLIYRNMYCFEYGNILFKGELEKTPFSLFNFYFIKIIGAARNIPEKIQSFFVLETPPIKDFDNVILITPFNFYSKKSYEILSKIDIDTQKKFNIYAQKPQEVSKYINNDFISALIKYQQKIDTRISLLITSKNILFIKPKYCSNEFLKHIAFIHFILHSQKRIKEDQWREYNQILGIIEVLNLLKKE